MKGDVPKLWALHFQTPRHLCSYFLLENLGHSSIKKIWLQKQGVLTPDWEVSLLTPELMGINLKVNWPLWSPIFPLWKRGKLNQLAAQHKTMKSTDHYEIGHKLTSYD